MNAQQKQIAGSFNEIVEIFTTANTHDDLMAIVSCDMRDEIMNALGNKTEEEIYYASWNYPEDMESTHYVFFPLAKRGGVCSGGLTEWTDCDNLDDLEHQWLNYDMEWCN